MASPEVKPGDDFFVQQPFEDWPPTFNNVRRPIVFVKNSKLTFCSRVIKR